MEEEEVLGHVSERGHPGAPEDSSDPSSTALPTVSWISGTACAGSSAATAQYHTFQPRSSWQKPRGKKKKKKKKKKKHKSTKLGWGSNNPILIVRHRLRREVTQRNKRVWRGLGYISSSTSKHHRNTSIRLNNQSEQCQIIANTEYT